MYTGDLLAQFVRGSGQNNKLEILRAFSEIILPSTSQSSDLAETQGMGSQAEDRLIKSPYPLKVLTWPISHITALSDLKKLASSFNTNIELRTWKVVNGERIVVRTREVPKYLVVPFDTETSGDLREDSVIKDGIKKIVISDLSKYLSLLQIGRVAFARKERSLKIQGAEFVTEYPSAQLESAQVFLIYMKDIERNYNLLPQNTRDELDGRGGPLAYLRDLVSSDRHHLAIMNSSFEKRQMEKYSHPLGNVIDLWPLAKLLRPATIVENPVKGDIEESFYPSDHSPWNFRAIATPGSFSLGAISVEFLGYRIDKEQQDAHWGVSRSEFSPQMVQYAALDAQVNFEAISRLKGLLETVILVPRRKFVLNTAQASQKAFIHSGRDRAAAKGELVRCYLRELRRLYCLRISVLREAGALKDILHLTKYEGDCRECLKRVVAARFSEALESGQIPKGYKGIDGDDRIVGLKFESEFGTVSAGFRAITKLDLQEAAKINSQFLENPDLQSFTKEGLSTFLKGKGFTASQTEEEWRSVSEIDYTRASLGVFFGNLDIQREIATLREVPIPRLESSNSENELLHEAINARSKRLLLLKQLGLSDSYPQILTQIAVLRADLREVLLSEIPDRGRGPREKLLVPQKGGGYSFVSEEGIVKLSRPNPKGDVGKLIERHGEDARSILELKISKDSVDDTLEAMGLDPSEREEILAKIFPAIGYTDKVFTSVHPAYSLHYTGM